MELEHIQLRTAAWTELHAWLAAAARTPDEGTPAELESAARTYAKTLDAEDDDASLAKSFRALGSCHDERCAREALGATPFGAAFAEVYPAFVAKRWSDRAAASRSGVDALREAVGPGTETLFDRLARDLAIAMPEEKIVVDLVGYAPEAGKTAPIRAAFASRGPCFVREKNETSKVHDARLIDCAFAYAAINMAAKSALHDALVKELGEREGERAYTLVAIHAAAAIVTAWEPKHVSVLRQSARASNGPAVDWLAEAWAARTGGESTEDFARRFAEVSRPKAR